MQTLQEGDPTGIGPFELLGRLGRGGLGEVFLGRRADLTLAAVTPLDAPHATAASFRARIARDLEIWRRIDAPWSVELLGADLDGPVPWLATEFVAGPTLEAAVTTTGPLSAQTAGVLAVRLADALADLHLRGITHRRLTPSSIVLAADGPRLVDPGLPGADPNPTHTMIGAPRDGAAFLAPEQALGDPAGPAADVFALASVLVFACTGEPPFGSDGPVPAILRRVIDEHPDLSGVPDGLAAVLQPYLVKHPDGRPTAARLRSALTPWDDVWMADSWPGSSSTAWLRST